MWDFNKKPPPLIKVSLFVVLVTLILLNMTVDGPQNVILNLKNILGDFINTLLIYLMTLEPG